MQWSTDSSTTLIYNGATISHGELASAPPAVIPPNSQALAGGMAVSDGFMTGKPRCSSIDDVFGEGYGRLRLGGRRDINWCRQGLEGLDLRRRP